MRTLGLAGEIILFVLAAVTSRFTLRHVESRWQIAAFCLVALAMEARRRDRRAAMRVIRPLLLAGAAAAGVIAVKAYLEPVAVHADARIVRHQTRQVARRLKDDPPLPAAPPLR